MRSDKDSSKETDSVMLSPPGISACATEAKASETGDTASAKDKASGNNLFIIITS